MANFKTSPESERLALRPFGPEYKMMGECRVATLFSGLSDRVLVITAEAQVKGNTLTTFLLINDKQQVMMLNL